MKDIERLLATILLIACAIAAPAAAQFEPNVSPTQEILETTPVAVMEDGFFAVDPVTKRVIDNVSPQTIMPGGSASGNAANEAGSEQEYVADNKGNPESGLDSAAAAPVSSTNSANPEESLVVGSGSALPSEEDADHYKNAAELPGLLKLTVTPTDVTISTKDDSLVVIPAGVKLIHNFITPKEIGPKTAFNEPVVLHNSQPPLVIELSSPVGFGAVQLCTVTFDEHGKNIYHPFASVQVYGSTHASM